MLGKVLARFESPQAPRDSMKLMYESPLEEPVSSWIESVGYI